MQTLDHDTADYGAERKAKISRARKAVLGLMAVGVIAAIAGAGTFASFSASTDNSATFKSARLGLSDTVSAATCYSPSAQPDESPLGQENGNIDSGNEASNCAALFSGTYTPGNGGTTTVTITNEGDTAGNVYLFADGTCQSNIANDAFDAGTGDLCGQVQISIERNIDGYCLYGPYSVSPANGCTAFDDSYTGYSYNNFDDKDFANKITAVSNLAAGASRSFTVKTYLHKSTGDTECSDNIGSAVVDGNNDGFVDADGRGCDNFIMNKTAELSIRWLMQA